MISASLALGLHLNIATPKGNAPESSSLRAPIAVGSDQPSWRRVRRGIRRDKTGTEAKCPKVVLATVALRLPTESDIRLYATHLLPPARPAATPSRERDPPSRDQDL